MKRWAIVRTDFIGYHQYPNAPDNVAFLRQPHRHKFHVEVRIEQQHNERDIEYITVLRELNEWITNQLPEGPNDSCETMAEEILRHVQDTYPMQMQGLFGSFTRRRAVSVQVTEDGENGALLES